MKKILVIIAFIVLNSNCYKDLEFVTCKRIDKNGRLISLVGIPKKDLDAYEQGCNDDGCFICEQ